VRESIAKKDKGEEKTRVKKKNNSSPGDAYMPKPARLLL